LRDEHVAAVRITRLESPQLRDEGPEGKADLSQAGSDRLKRRLVRRQPYLNVLGSRSPQIVN
jgi:hypothetical protein